MLADEGAMRAIRLWTLLLEPAVIVEHPSGVRYQNRVGGSEPCLKELEGVLVPIGFEPEAIAKICHCPYAPGTRGIADEIADAIDAVFMAEPMARFLRVDRARQSESCNGWVHVAIDSPETTVIELYEEYTGYIYGFGATRGVLTWNPIY
jgi:hypothetical protein